VRAASVTTFLLLADDGLGSPGGTTTRCGSLFVLLQAAAADKAFLIIIESSYEAS
jgi:hypothetical protein